MCGTYLFDYICICTYVHMYIYPHTCLHVHIFFTCLYICLCAVQLRTYVDECMHLRILMHVQHVRTYICAYIRTSACMYSMHEYTYTLIHVCVCVCVCACEYV